LGVSEPLIQLVPDRNRIIVELPGIRDPQQAIQTLQGTGLLEFVEAGTTSLPEGAIVPTDYQGPGSITPETALTPRPVSATPGPPRAAAPTVAAPGVTTPTATAPPTETVGAPGALPPAALHTILTGEHLADAGVVFNQGRPEISFRMRGDGVKIFGDYTSTNVGRYLAIVLDKRVISSPRIQSPIVGGDGVITGAFTLEEARRLAIQLKYGALPVAMKVEEQRTVGPTLGQDSIRKSLIAGAIGLGLVAFFMIAYYQLPGVLADLALIVYATLVFALFKLIPVVLTLAGIAGFILSIGMAVDANILIFERTREELRQGRTLGGAIEVGFRRAWSSIRDSNIATLITCAILYWFGANFGASIIRGFALTLAIGVLMSMFTAITVTRTFLRIVESASVDRPGLAALVRRVV
ncbi:MAG: protein translocase subunit SecD, partial [Chloroflexi bacterium]|nr:protein translocase subunit SecD [Chloroflexota bacterium]